MKYLKEDILKNEMENKIAENKIKYHISKAKLPFEEKYEIIKALQCIDLEMRKSNPNKKMKSYYRIWG